MHMGTFFISGDFVRELVTGSATAYEKSLDDLIDWMMRNREEARKTFFLPPGTEFIDMVAHLPTDCVQFTVKHPDLPYTPSGGKPPQMMPQWKSWGYGIKRTTVFLRWGIQ